MAPCGAWPSLAVLLSLFAALLPGSGGAQVSVHPLEAIVHQGGSVVVNCSATCNQSNLEVGLETVFNKKLVSEGASWKVFELSDVQEDSSGLCYATCGDTPEQETATISITMYAFPERVELAPLPPWQPVGENFTLRCQVWGGAPRANLSVVLLRGQDELSRQLAVGEPAEVTATMPARREDYGANFSCRAELQLRGLELFKNSSTSRQLRTFERPHSVILEPPVLVGNEYMLRCQVTHVFPVGFLVVTLQRGGQVIYSESLKRFTNVNLANVTLSYRVPSQGRDLLQPVTCHARFNLNGMVVRSSSAPLMLTALAWSTESCLQPSAWSTESKALAFTSIAALVVILLAVGAAYLCKCL